jgi:hypothetical protein
VNIFYLKFTNDDPRYLSEVEVEVLVEDLIYLSSQFSLLEWVGGRLALKKKL